MAYFTYFIYFKEKKDICIFSKENLLLSLYCYEEEKHFFHHKSIITLKRSYGFIRLGETIGYLLHQNANHRSYKFNDFEKHFDICCTKMQTSTINLTQKFRKKVRNAYVVYKIPKNNQQGFIRLNNK